MLEEMLQNKMWKIFHDKSNVYEYSTFDHVNTETFYHGSWGYDFLYYENFKWELSETGCIYEMWDCVLREDDIVLDMGANIGFFTLHAAEKASCVYSIDGSPEVYSCLVENCKDLPNVVTINASMLSKGQDQSHLWSFRGNKMRITLEELMEIYGLEKIDFIKCDIEGGEWDFFMNLSEETLSKIDRIALETHEASQIPNFFLPGKIRHDFTWDGQTMLYFVTLK
jgi:FkbM family methyltransferase